MIRNKLELAIGLLIFCFSACSCNKEIQNPDSIKESWGETILIDPAVEYQIMDGFGASDAWRCQYVGKNWPLSKREEIADLLFSQGFKENGSPKGIGLSMWRFYIGAGSAEQGNSSGIDHEWRRAECFQKNDGTYDWNKQQGQRWFLDAARARGVNKIIAFSLSAPVHYTKNGKAFAPADGSMNIQSDKMDEYSQFLVDVCEHFKQQGVVFDYLSPVNETQWDWTGHSQEGTPASNSEVCEFVKLISQGLTQKGLNTQIVVSETAKLNYLYGGEDKPGRNNHIDEFFKSGSQNNISHLPNVANVISGHSYFTTYPNQALIDVRKQLAVKLAASEGKTGYWQSEFSILENTSDIGGGWGRDLSINTALYVARVMHFDITLANAKSWQWWTAISPYDFKDGLIYIDNGNNGINGPTHPDAEILKSDGQFRESKLLWALGNYSRFIRPGMVRIKADFSLLKPDEARAQELMLSAYKDKNNNDLVVVFVNYSTSEKKVTIGNLGYTLKLSDPTIEAYVTTNEKSMEKVMMDADKIALPSRSIVTIRAKLKN